MFVVKRIFKNLWRPIYWVIFAPMRRPIPYALIMCCRFYLLLGVLLFIFQKHLIFQTGYGSWQDCPALVSRGAIKIDKAADLGLVRGWYLPKADAVGRVYVFHGNYGHACRRTYLLSLFQSLPLEVVLVEYPGYDGTEVDYQKILQRGPAIYDEMQAKRPLPSLAFGESLGTGVATYLGKERPLKGLLLYAGYPSITKVASQHFSMYPYEFMVKYPFPAEVWARSVGEPVLMIHGSEDEVISYSLGLEQSANFINSKIRTLDGAKHNSWMSYLSEADFNAIRDFLHELVYN